MTLGSLEFPEFKRTFRKQYKNETEEGDRLLEFKKNTFFINEHNRLFNDGKYSFTTGVNIFADMNHEDFVRMTSGARPARNFT